MYRPGDNARMIKRVIALVDATGDPAWIAERGEILLTTARG
jgi:hypothetical protein